LHGEGSRSQPVPPLYEVERGTGGEVNRYHFFFALMVLPLMYFAMKSFSWPGV